MSAECTCPYVPEKYHYVYYGITEPSSAQEWDPGCPVHRPYVMPREDTVTNTVEDAARFERERAEAAGEYDDRPTIRDI